MAFVSWSVSIPVIVVTIITVSSTANPKCPYLMYPATSESMWRSTIKPQSPILLYSSWLCTVSTVATHMVELPSTFCKVVTCQASVTMSMGWTLPSARTHRTTPCTSQHGGRRGYNVLPLSASPPPKSDKASRRARLSASTASLAFSTRRRGYSRGSMPNCLQLPTPSATQAYICQYILHGMAR